MIHSLRVAVAGAPARGIHSNIRRVHTIAGASSGSQLVVRFRLGVSASRRLGGVVRSSPHSLRSRSSLPPLQDLVVAGGRVHESVAVTTSSHGMTLRALGPIAKGALIVGLPGQLQLSQDPASDPESLTQLIQLVPKELWGGKLALKLLYERYRGEDSPFAPYIGSLPVGFPGIPIFWSKAELDALEYPPVSSQVVKRCRWLVEFSGMEAVRRLGGHVFGKEAASVLSPNTLGWALSAVTSRAFRPGGEGGAAALLPLIDMCNHDQAPNARVSASDSRALNLQALRDIAPGEDVTLSYGELPNDFLLLDYGFVVEDNAHDSVTLSFDPGFVEAAKAVANVGSAVDDMKVQAWQARALDRLGLTTQNKEVHMLSVQAEGDPPVDERLLAGIRVLCCTREDLVQAGLHTLGKWTPARTGAWEASVLKTAVGMGLIGLSQFSTSAEEDQRLLAGDASSDMKLAISLRLGKKSVLTRCIQALEARLKDVGDEGDEGVVGAVGVVGPRKKKQRERVKKPGKGFGGV